MPFLSGIFGNSGANQQQQPGQQSDNNQQQQPNQGNQASQQTNGPNNQQMQKVGQNPQNPLDPFMDLFKPQPGANQNQNQDQPIFGKVNPEQLQEQVSKMNFASSIDPALAQKALSGDMQAFMDVLNGVARNAFSSSLQMSQNMVEHGVKTGTDRFGQSLDSRFRDYEVRNQTADIPALQHPIGQAMLQSLKTQIATNNPRLSAKDVHQKAVDMMKTFGSEIAGGSQQQQSQGQQTPAEPDWSKFLE